MEILSIKFKTGYSMPPIELSVGQTLIAKDVCIMTESGENALTIGKEYVINSIDYFEDDLLHSIAITDDCLERHHFLIDESNRNWDFYFKLK